MTNRDLGAMVDHARGVAQPASLNALVALLRGCRIVVVAGAGCSTESGIPDYGGLGSNRRRAAVRFKEFVADGAVRARYWARSTVGWPRVAGARPNPAHVALADLERTGAISGVITQNVDGLHHRAGSERVVELHGSLARVRCMACGALEPRAGFQERLRRLNPGFHDAAALTAPDGDVEVAGEDYDAFRVPDCRRCGGLFKPDVVFFGENVPKSRVERAWAFYRGAEVLLVVGSSLAVFSGLRFVHRAAKEGRPVAIVNLGRTRGDEHAAVKVEQPLGTLLPALVDRLGNERGAASARDAVD